jgi:hypothetical protein
MHMPFGPDNAILARFSGSFALYPFLTISWNYDGTLSSLARHNIPDSPWRGSIATALVPLPTCANFGSKSPSSHAFSVRQGYEREWGILFHHNGFT